MEYDNTQRCCFVLNCPIYTLVTLYHLCGNLLNYFMLETTFYIEWLTQCIQAPEYNIGEKRNVIIEREY